MCGCGSDSGLVSATLTAVAPCLVERLFTPHFHHSSANIHFYDGLLKIAYLQVQPPAILLSTFHTVARRANFGEQPHNLSTQSKTSLRRLLLRKILPQFHYFIQLFVSIESYTANPLAAFRCAMRHQNHTKADNLLATDGDPTRLGSHKYSCATS